MDRWTLSREYGSAQGTVRHEVFGTGPPVVLVHITPFSSYVWRRVVPALSPCSLRERFGGFRGIGGCFRTL
jgi:pimeloyl-ACP methyl ester carboxylesterase